MARIGLTALLLLALAAPASAHFSPSGSSCKFVSFQANSGNGAFEITASGVSCSTARSVVRSIGQRGDSRGYYCRFRQHDDGMQHTDWRCTRGSRRIVFVIS